MGKLGFPRSENKHKGKHDEKRKKKITLNVMRSAK